MKTKETSPSEKLEAIYDEYLEGEKQTPRTSISFDEYLRNWKYKSAYWKVDVCKECGFSDFYLLLEALEQIKQIQQQKINPHYYNYFYDSYNKNPVRSYKEGDLVYQCDGYGNPLKENGKLVIRECIPYIIFSESTKEQRKKYTNPKYISTELCESNPKRFPHYTPGNAPHNDEYKTGLCPSCHRFGDKCVCGSNKVKPNQKKFDTFNEERFNAYLNKFNVGDMIEMLGIIKERIETYSRENSIKVNIEIVVP